MSAPSIPEHVVETAQAILKALEESGFTGWAGRAKKGAVVRVRSKDEDVKIMVDVKATRGGGTEMAMLVDIYTPYAKYALEREIVNAMSAHPELGTRFLSGLVIGKNILVAVQPNSVDEVPRLATEVRRVVEQTVAGKKAIVDSMEPSEAMALYLLAAASNNRLYNLLAETSGITKRMIIDKVKESLPESDRTTVVHPDVILFNLHEDRRISIDEDGYVVLDGKRVIDIVAKYTGGRLVYVPYNKDSETCDARDSERVLLSWVVGMYDRDLKDIVKGWKKVPDKLVDVILKRRSYLIYDVFAEDPDMWYKLNFDTRVKLIASNNYHMWHLANKYNWSWILDDYATVAAFIRGEHPSRATGIITRFPRLIGGNFDTVVVGNETFLRMENDVILQVRKVGDGEVVVHGTVFRGKVGMVAKGRTVIKAADVIKENLEESVAEFKDVIERYRRSGVNLNVSVYETSLFSVPQVVLELPNRRVVVPLQPRFADIIEKHVERQRATSDEEKAPA